MGVKIPATGTGDTTPTVATEKISGTDFQLMKLVDGTVGGSQGAAVSAAGSLQVKLAEYSAGLLLGASVGNFPGNQGVTIASVAGGVGPLGASVSNFPAIQPVSGYLGASLAGGYVGASVAGGYLGASVANLPGTQPVSIASSNVQVGASISNFPATQAVSGTVTASVVGYVGASLPAAYIGASLAGGYVGASVANTPQVSVASSSATLPVNIASYAVTQPISLASTSVTQPVSGYLGASLAGGYVGASLAGGYTGASISNTVPVSLASSSVQIGASISNFPTTQTVSGSTVSVGGSVIVTGGSLSTQNVGGSVAAAPLAAAVGGASPFHFVCGASVNNVNVKNAAGTLYSLTATSIASQARYIKLYDKSSTPSVGQDLPVHTHIVPGGASPLVGNQSIIHFPVGLRFATGIGFGTTLVGTDTDKTAVGASDIILNLTYF